MMWLPSCPWPCFMSETNVLLIGFSEIGEYVDSLAFGFFSEILIANGAFWINLSHQLRAEISQFFSYIIHSSPATYFMLVGSYWKKEGGGSAPKKKGGGGGSGPHGPPPWVRPWYRIYDNGDHNLSNMTLYDAFMAIWLMINNHNLPQNQLKQIETSYTRDEINQGDIPGLTRVHDERTDDKSATQTVLEMSSDVKSQYFVHLLEFIYTGELMVQHILFLTIFLFFS